MIKIFLFEKMKEAVPFVDKKIFNYIYECRAESFESFEKYNLLAFDFYDVLGDNKDTSSIMLYHDDTNLLVFCEEDCVKSKVEKIFSELSLPDDTSPGYALYKFFEKLLGGVNWYLQTRDRLLNAVEEAILSDNNYDARIFSDWRKELLSLKRYFMQLNTIFDEMNENDNNLLDDACVRRINVLCTRTDRYLSAVLNLQESLRQIQEAHRSQLSIRQNELMQIFTIVTVIFLPLTLITGWYGMNFKHMPELSWKYGYGGAAALCVFIAAVMIWVFKRKKWF